MQASLSKAAEEDTDLLTQNRLKSITTGYSDSSFYGCTEIASQEQWVKKAQ
jgi:hypothetical protein